MAAEPLQSAPKIWLSAEQIADLPMAGSGWEALLRRTQQPLVSVTLADQDSAANVTVLALALYAARTGDATAAARVRAVCNQIQGTERGARALAVGRELGAYIIAADLVGLSVEDDGRFRSWLRDVQRQQFEGRTLRSTHEDRPNNWGTHAGASRLAVAVYLDDQDEIVRAADVFRGWLGERSSWQGFEFGETWWQPRGFRNYGVNPVGAMRDGHSIDGVLPDDQRRGGKFTWPPPRENYVYEALQGALLQALILERQGYDVWSWGDQALLRAFVWLQEQAHYPAEGDDTWMPYVINSVYGVNFPLRQPAIPGKGMGFTDWTHGAR